MSFRLLLHSFKFALSLFDFLRGLDGLGLYEIKFRRLAFGQSQLVSQIADSAVFLGSEDRLRLGLLRFRVCALNGSIPVLFSLDHVFNGDGSHILCFVKRTKDLFFLLEDNQVRFL